MPQIYVPSQHKKDVITPNLNHDMAYDPTLRVSRDGLENIWLVVFDPGKLQSTLPGTTAATNKGGPSTQQPSLTVPPGWGFSHSARLPEVTSCSLFS